MDITVSIGSGTEHCIDITISDDEPFMPDLLDHLMCRAAANALVLWHDVAGQTVDSETT